MFHHPDGNEDTLTYDKVIENLYSQVYIEGKQFHI